MNRRTELTALRRDGTEFPVEIAITAIAQHNEPIFTASLRDISQRKAMEAQVQQLAFFDPLTRLPNRRLLNDRLAHAMAASKRNHNWGALLFLDLDNLKPLNDAHGHQAGDVLLAEVADRLTACVREMDTVARFGGDEFVMVISELTTDKTSSAAQAHGIAEKIRARLAEPYRISFERGSAGPVSVEHVCTASIGVALFDGHEATQDEPLKRADMAMYEAKSARNAVVAHRHSDRAAAG